MPVIPRKKSVYKRVTSPTKIDQGVGARFDDLVGLPGPPGGFTLGSTYLGGPLFTDAFGAKRAPSPWQLIEKYKSLIYALVAKNANARCRVPLRLYTDSSRGAKPRSICDPYPVTTRSFRRHLSRLGHTRVSPSSVDQVYEVRSHPILDALDRPDPYGYFDRIKLLSLISRYNDVVGQHFLMPEGNGWRDPNARAKGPPIYLWVLYSQYVLPVRMAGSPLINYFQYFAEHIPFDYLLWFRTNNSLRDPYGAGYSPTYAGDQYADLEDRFVAIQDQVLGLGPRPNFIATAVDPLQPPGETERRRFESELRQKHAAGYAGGVLVNTGAWNFTPVSYSPADLGGLQVSEYDMNRLCNLFGIPPSYFSTETNLANLQAADTQHARDAVEPWCVSVASTLTQVVRQFDQRLFFAFDPCVPEDEEREARIIDMQLKNGLVTINQANEESQWPKASWGDAPWFAGTLKQPDMIEASHEMGMKALDHGMDMSERQQDYAESDESSDDSDDDSDWGDRNGNGDSRSFQGASGHVSRTSLDMRMDTILSAIEYDLGIERAGNPYHDPATGRFTSGPGGSKHKHKEKHKGKHKEKHHPKSTAARKPRGPKVKTDTTKETPRPASPHQTSKILQIKAEHAARMEKEITKKTQAKKESQSAVKEETHKQLGPQQTTDILKLKAAHAQEAEKKLTKKTQVSEQPKARLNQAEFHGDVSESEKAFISKLSDSVPQHVAKALADNGHKIVYADRLETYDPALAKEHPRGWSEGTTWANANGFYSPFTQTVFVAREYKSTWTKDYVAMSQKDLAGVFRHETGHAYDEASGLPSKQHEFVHAHTMDVSYMSDLNQKAYSYYLQSGDAGRSETFAELYAHHTGGGSDKYMDLETNFPRCSEYMKRRLKL